MGKKAQDRTASSCLHLCIPCNWYCFCQIVSCCLSPSLVQMYTGSQFSLKKLVITLLKKWNTLAAGQEEPIRSVEGQRERENRDECWMFSCCSGPQNPRRLWERSYNWYPHESSQFWKGMAQILTGIHSANNRKNVSWLLHQGKHTFFASQHQRA